MTMIALERIRSNPFRDFELHPIDPVQVDKLKASIDADKFWASIVARKAGGDYEIAFGHHRIEAARQLGMKEAPIEVRDLSDWQMVRMLASENATQRGSSAAAALDAIAAISKVLAYQCFRHDAANLVTILTGLDRRGGETIWGNIRQGEGPGWHCILDVTPKDAFTRSQVHTALGILKDSGRMATIVADARARAEAEIAAEEKKSPAPPKKTPAPKSKPSASKDVSVAPRTAPTREITFDANCARLFRLDSHVAEFRRIVTDPTIRSFLPVDQQYAFAQSIINALKDREMTVISLREQANVLLYENLGAPRAKLSTSKKRPQDHRITDGMNLLRRGTHDVKRGCLMLASVLEDGEELSSAALARLDELTDAITDAMASLKPDARKRRGNLRLINKGDAS